MIIDKDYQIRTMPVIIKTPQKDLDSFKKEAEQAIQSFFEEIEKTYKGNEDCFITIEYKIVGNASPASHYHTQMHKPSNRTEFVRSTFFDYFHKAQIKNQLLQLADKQYRSNLKKPALTEFQEGLNNLHLVEKKRSSAYQYHLWAIILHATKSSFKKELKKLMKILKPVQDLQIDEKKRHSA